MSIEKVIKICGIFSVKYTRHIKKVNKAKNFEKLVNWKGHENVRKSKIVSKNSILRKMIKIVKLEFSCQKLMIYCDYKILKFNRIWIFTLKNVKIQHFSFILGSVLLQNLDFWRENSNYPGKIGPENSQKLMLLAQKFKFTICNFSGNWNLLNFWHVLSFSNSGERLRWFFRQIITS